MVSYSNLNIYSNIVLLALLTKSHLVQNKLADYFKRKKSDDQKDEIAKDNTSELGMFGLFIVGFHIEFRNEIYETYSIN